MTTSRAKTVLCALTMAHQCALASSVLAHPGHGALPLPADSTAHYLFEPMHMLPALGAGILIVFAFRWIGRCRLRQRASLK